MTKADQLFRQYGFMKTTVADIADELQMSTANIYKFFPSRNAILESCAERNIATLKAKLAGIVAIGGGSMDRLSQCVLSIFDFHKELLQNERQIFKLVVTAVEEGWPCIRDYDTFLQETFRQLIVQGVETGEFRQTDAAETAQAVLDCLSIALHPHIRYGHVHDSNEESVRAQLRFVAKALRRSEETTAQSLSEPLISH
ncbi:DNA-binding transcriptional regulator, AcrR family [Terrimicrobium sacchariphilum]|uniref:DNA-binding transcriptional regulator, AcrR family n=2 Tax=Terrimicrobium sacchariphilum TaxID=690879 RepID=A0A146GDX9_TERSA|nr:TetR family transcriptional regulator [Terrimicrobium sacchariphilum]GAT35343.1 DNA-binding transcriptional regulator, AcrR family [Terrimicrobium sacchariphilum]